MIPKYTTKIVFLFSIVVCATIAAQFFWIDNALRLQKENFHQTASGIVQNVAQTIENEYGCVEAFNKINLLEGEKIIVLHQREDSIHGKHFDTVKQYSPSFRSDSLVTINQTFPFQMTSEIFIKYHYSPSKTTSGKNTHNNLPAIPKWQTDSIFGGIYPVSYALGKDFFIQYIDSLLRMQFNEHSIPQQYHFKLFDRLGKSEILNSSVETAPKNTNHYNASLYNKNHFFSPHELTVWVEGKNTYFIGKIWIVFLGSIIVMTFLGSGAIYLSKIIIKQKKLAKIKNDFISNMSHEFKTPLSNLSLAIETIEGLHLSNHNPNINKCYAIIKNESYRLSKNVEKILQASAVNDEVPMDYEQIDLLKLIDNIIESFSIRIGEREGHIIRHYPEREVYISGDKTHLSNVFHNIIENSLKYNNNIPEIKVKILKKNQCAFIYISDNGIGISPEEMHRIFKQFYRIPSNLHTHNGFGLGLYYVKKIVEAHKGNIVVKSKKQKGSTFSIQLPTTYK